MAEIREIENQTPIAELEENETDDRIYELGFHLLPSISVENIGAEFSKVKSIIEEGGAIFVSEDFPKLRNLAYVIDKSNQGKKQKYDKAYFGWIKFNVDPENLSEMKRKITSLDTVLRFLIIKTIKESTLYTPKPAYLRSDPNRTNRRNKEEQEKATDSPISEAELDKTIEDLVIS